METLKAIFKVIESQAAYLDVDFTEIPDKHYPKFCHVAVMSSPSALEAIDVKRLDPTDYVAIVWAAVRAYPSSIQYVDTAILNGSAYKELALYAVRSDPSTLEFATNHLLNKDYREVAYEAVVKDGAALQFVPKGERDNDLVYHAVRSSHNAFYYIDPKDYSKDEYFKLALYGLSDMHQGGMLLETIDDSLFTDEEYIRLAKAATFTEAISLAFTKNKRIPNATYAAMVISAMEHRSDAIVHIDGKKLTDEEYRKAIIIASRDPHFGRNVQNIAVDRLDEATLKTIFKNTGLSL